MPGEAPMNLALTAEVLAAGVGVLSNDPIKTGDLVVASRLPGKWRKGVDAFMKGQPCDPGREGGLAKLDMEKSLEQLTEPVESAAEIVVNVGNSDLGQAVLDVVVAARQYLAAQWPTVVVSQAWGPELMDVSPTEKRRAAALLAVVDAPGAVLDEMRAHTLEPAQAEAFRVCYPQLFQMLADLIWEELSACTAKKPLPWRQEQVLRVLWNVPPQQQIQTPRGTGGGSPGSAPIRSKELQTKAQRLAG